MSRKLQVVYGGQYGSEGKGHVVAHLARQAQAAGTPMKAVRVGGANAGHTFFTWAGEKQVTQILPISPFVYPDAVGLIGAAAVVLPDLLANELDALVALNGKQYTKDNPILIDVKATTITQADMDAETELKKSIGSTGEGVGSATARKVMRTAKTFQEELTTGLIPKDWAERILPYVKFVDTVAYLNDSTFSGIVQLEGTQGYLLSLHTSGHYPFATSRQCSPEGLMSQCGVSGRAFDDVQVVAVFRTYPIRVGGNSGYIPNEIGWPKLCQLAGAEIKPERTTVTKKVRRIASFSYEDSAKTIADTAPTEIAITFVDYVFGNLYTIKFDRENMGEIPAPVEEWAVDFQDRIGVPVTMLSVGPGQIFDR